MEVLPEANTAVGPAAEMNKIAIGSKRFIAKPLCLSELYKQIIVFWSSQTGVRQSLYPLMTYRILIKFPQTSDISFQYLTLRALQLS
jgi:urate oxidase